MTMMRVPFVTLALVFTTACGTGFVKGWERDQPQTKSAEQLCAEGGKIWADGKCQSGTSLTDPYKDAKSKDQCPADKGRVWAKDGSGTLRCLLVDEAKCDANPKTVWVSSVKDQPCQERATLELSPSNQLQQAVVQGQAITSLDIKYKAGSHLAPRNETCPGFFKITGAKLESAAADDKAVAKGKCEVDIVATSDKGADSVPVHVVVTVKGGFLALCHQMDGDGWKKPENASLWATIKALRGASQLPFSTSCEDVAKKLGTATSLNLCNSNLTVLDPLVGFQSLNTLYLDRGTLTSLTPIAGMSNLAFLYVSDRNDTVGKHDLACPAERDIANPGVLDYCRSKEISDCPKSTDGNVFAEPATPAKSGDEE